MEFERELLQVINDTTDAKMSKKATMLLSHLYTLEEKRTELKKKISNFILDYQTEDELVVENNVVVKKKTNKTNKKD